MKTQTLTPVLRGTIVFDASSKNSLQGAIDSASTYNLPVSIMLFYREKSIKMLRVLQSLILYLANTTYRRNSNILFCCNLLLQNSESTRQTYL